MIYTNREKLTICVLRKAKDCIPLDMIKNYLVKKPSNIIYVELNDKLYGIISMGDIHRAAQFSDSVSINFKFTKCFLNQQMRVRQLFKEKDCINEIPVIDEENHLLGAYERWDSVLDAKRSFLFFNQMVARNLLKEKRVILVQPNNEFIEKTKVFYAWVKRLGKYCKLIDYSIHQEKIQDSIEEADFVLFADEEEKRGVYTLLKDLYGLHISWERMYTYGEFCNMLNDSAYTGCIDKVISYIQNEGINFLCMYYKNSGSAYQKLFCENINRKYNEIGKKPGGIEVYPQMQEGFFSDLYEEEYARQILNLKTDCQIINGISMLKNQNSTYLNVYDGERKTVGQPENYIQNIYFFGPCIVAGMYVEDQYTIESFLQQKINEDNLPIRVVNYSAWGSVASVMRRLTTTPLRKNDIVIFYMDNRSIDGVPNINLFDILEKHNVSTEWVVDNPVHVNHKVNEIYADEIYERIRPYLQLNIAKVTDFIESASSSFIKNTYLNQYFEGLDEAAYDKIGSIVMNCNPFTYGHRYLIEQALQQVDFLIIFVVEEDKSIFSFAERFDMVCEGVKDLDHVMVVPSGNFILSQTTFPEYFIKIADEDIHHNVEHDITLFAEMIAPQLGITYRFVGEELVDDVTNEYNKAMKKILPAHGIHLIEIPRMEKEGKIVSATMVRRCIEDGNEMMLDMLVPESTKKIIFRED